MSLEREGRCQSCGAREGLTTRQRYVGGEGYRPFVECVDQVACARRTNERTLPPAMAAYFNRLLAEVA